MAIQPSRNEKPYQVERPTKPVDPRNPSASHPHFQVQSIADNGLWDSERGELTDPYFDPTQTTA